VLAWASVRECHPTGLITPDSYCDHALLVNRELVIPFRVMARDRHLWTALTVGLFVGSAIWIALRPSWQSIIVGGGLIVLLAWQRVTMLVTRRVSGNAPAQFIVTSELIGSPPVWSLRWAPARSLSRDSAP
jgi:hypothetical protein